MTLETIKQVRNRYCSITLTVGIVISIILTISGFNGEGRGLILGTIFSILNFILMAETLPYRMGRSRKSRIFLSTGSLTFRYALLALPIILSLRMDRFSTVATVCGIFLIQLTILTDHLQGMIIDR